MSAETPYEPNSCLNLTAQQRIELRYLTHRLQKLQRLGEKPSSELEAAIAEFLLELLGFDDAEPDRVKETCFCAVKWFGEFEFGSELSLVLDIAAGFAKPADGCVSEIAFVFDEMRATLRRITFTTEK